MDMAIANLFKHKVHFHLVGEDPDYEEPYLFSKGRQYSSGEIENIESIGMSDWVDLCLKRLQAFFVHIVSTIVHEERHHIDNITVKATLKSGEEYDDYELIEHSLDNPRDNINLFSMTSETSIYSFPENLLNEPFSIDVEAYSYFAPNIFREMELMNRLRTPQAEEMNDDVTVPFTPPDETFRQERCVICLESAPNILYLDCMHIAVCDFCDNMKRTTALRLRCDVCRATISRRIKI